MRSISVFILTCLKSSEWHQCTKSSKFDSGYCTVSNVGITLRWRHNGRDSVSNHQPHGCLLNRLFRRRSNKTSKLRVTGLCAGNSPGTDEFPAQKGSNAENVYIWIRHQATFISISFLQLFYCIRNKIIKEMHFIMSLVNIFGASVHWM